MIDRGEHPVTHLIEPTGYAGVFQHTCQLALGLRRAGRQVVLHTGHQHEAVSLDGVELCTCCWWPRPDGERRIEAGARRAETASRLAGRTLPHLLRSATAGSVMHLQGTAASGGLNLLVLGAARKAGHRVVYSPHDVFTRRGAVDGALLRLAYRPPHAIVVYSRADRQRLREQGVPANRIHLSPLVQLVPSPSVAQLSKWRREWRAGDADRVVLFAGFIRPEKRLDVLIESARTWPPGRRLAVVGPDRGAWDQCAQTAKAHGVDISARLGFVDIDDFAAAISAADLVVVPSERASQSGVLALARELKTPTVAADVGGMAELACRTFRTGDVAGLSRAINAELAEGHAQGGSGAGESDAIGAHLRAYGDSRHDTT
ncbi:glycosyltransferase family 4 protein [Mycolicibacterium litorale]|nr:glycosyltransferase [Mycolicibacterium litorale]TDY06499.1 glycosyltransferase involved in cell wall biosynthesis [Mycolicibacterium litorale]